MSTAEQTLTISTRLRIDDPATDEILSDLCTLYSTALYTAISRKNRKIPVLKPDFMREFGLSSRNFNSVIRYADGMVKSVLSNMENYADEHEAKAVQLNKLILKSQKKRKDTVEKLKETVEKIDKTCKFLIEKPNSPSQLKLLQQLQEQHKALKQKRERLNREIAQRARRRDRHYRMQDQILQKVKDKHASICFGSRKLFNAQHHLAANRFGDIDHWKRIWQKSRNNMFFSIGSKDETMGNQVCVLSLVGRVKYARETRFSTHQEAAWCIGLVGMGRKIERMRLPRRFVVKQNGFVLGLATPADVVEATGSKKLSRLAKGMSKAVGDLVTARRDEVIARKRAKHEERLQARLSPHPASNGGHWQVSNARSADDHIPY